MITFRLGPYGARDAPGARLNWAGCSQDCWVCTPASLGWDPVRAHKLRQRIWLGGRAFGEGAGEEGRGKSFSSVLAESPTHPYLQLDLPGPVHKAGRWTSCQHAQAPSQWDVEWIWTSGKSIPAPGRGGKSFSAKEWLQGLAASALKGELELLKTEPSTCPWMWSGAKCSIPGTRTTEWGLSESPGARLGSQIGCLPPQPARLPLAAAHPDAHWIWPFSAFDTDMVSLPGIRASISLFYFWCSEFAWWELGLRTGSLNAATINK